MRRISASLLGVLLVTVLVLGASPGAAQAEVSYCSEEIEVVRLINEYRTSKGLDALLVSDVLSESATKHCLDMAKYGFFSHTTLDSDWFPVGSTAGERMVACGYPPFKSWSENIAAGYESADRVFTAWKHSVSHNANMLTRGWTVVGVSRVVDPQSVDGTYWATDFGSHVDGTAHENGQPTHADTVAPVVVITSPTAGTDIVGPVTVCATATDDRGVVRVDLYADGAKIASDDEPPYAFVWDTSGLDPGAYVLEVRAFDLAANVGTAGCAVHVSSSPAATTTTSTTSTTTAGTPSTTTTTSASPSPSTTSTTLPVVAFTDVPAGNTFYEPISILAAAGVVHGYADGMFYPGNPVSRAQFTKIIMLALDEHTVEIDNPSDPTFNDVRYVGSPYPFDFVEEAAALGIIKGFGDGSFGPEKQVTRLQLALMLVRAGDVSFAEPPAGYACPFVDVPSYAREAVMVAHYNGLVSGKTEARFDPYSPATRGQVAKMVCGLLEALRP